MRINISILPKNPHNFTDFFQGISQVLFFDIETTGFSPNTSHLYLIGCVYWDQEKKAFTMIQWFCEEKEDESLILDRFFHLLNQYQVVVSYNGQGFDIPYLLKKCRQYQLPYDFSTVESLDLYKKILPYKNFLKLSSLKQKSVEEFLEIFRDDIYSGGELIRVYDSYLSAPSEALYNTLLQHNSDDLAGLLKILPILSYAELFEGKFIVHSCTFTNDLEEMIFTMETENPLPKQISFGNGSFYFTGFQKTCKLKVRLYSGTLKHFYANYQDYYYLPAEDLAIHKSVAFYVDKNHRVQSKAANCYGKKAGKFLPQISPLVTPSFRTQYKDKITYFEPTKEFLNNNSLVKSYVMHLLNYLATV